MSKKNNYNSFLTVLLGSHKFSDIAQSLITPLLLPNQYQITPRSAEHVMLKFFLALEAENLSLFSNITVPVPVPSSLNETLKNITH